MEFWQFLDIHHIDTEDIGWGYSAFLGKGWPIARNRDGSPMRRFPNRDVRDAYIEWAERQTGSWRRA